MQLSVSWICLASAGMLLLLAMSGPLFALSLLGHFTTASLVSGPETLRRLGLPELAVMVAVTLFFAPVLHLAALLCGLVAARSDAPPAWLLRPLSATEALQRWSMIEVFLLAALIAYVRLQAWTSVSVGLAPLALAGALLASRGAMASLDIPSLWERVPCEPVPTRTAHGTWLACEICGLICLARDRQPCARCGRKLHMRKRHSLRRTFALLLTAALLLLPANLLPVMSVTRFGRHETDTIFSGVVALTRHGLWGLAAIIFVASIMIPALKVLGLSVMLWMTRRRSAEYLRERTRMFRLVHAIGRWSMVDVFSVTILASLLDMGRLSTVLPGYGVVAFGSVVILTMLASEAFDPRLMWDAAGLNHAITAREAV